MKAFLCQLISKQFENEKIGFLVIYNESIFKPKREKAI